MCSQTAQENFRAPTHVTPCIKLHLAVAWLPGVQCAMASPEVRNSAARLSCGTLQEQVMKIVPFALAASLVLTVPSFAQHPDRGGDPHPSGGTHQAIPSRGPRGVATNHARPTAPNRNYSDRASHPNAPHVDGNRRVATTRDATSLAIIWIVRGSIALYRRLRLRPCVACVWWRPPPFLIQRLVLAGGGSRPRLLRRLVLELRRHRDLRRSRPSRLVSRL